MLKPCYFLASDRASHITMHNLCVDGGATLEFNQNSGGYYIMNEHIAVKELSEKLLEDYKTESSFFFCFTNSNDISRRRVYYSKAS